jgi:hypothetical protein
MTGILHETPARPGRHKAYLHDAARTLAGRLSEVERLVSEVVSMGMTEQARNDLRQRLRELCSVAVSQSVISSEPLGADDRYRAVHRAASEAQRSMAALRRTESALKECSSGQLESWARAREALAAPYALVLSEAAAERERIGSSDVS